MDVGAPPAATSIATGTATEMATPHPALLAMSIAKYVFKQGRRTVRPETVLRESELLPPKPARAAANADDASQDGAADGAADAASSRAEGISWRPPLQGGSSSRWDWESVERERVRGMNAARHMAGLDMLQYEFTAEEGPVIGKY